MIKDNFLSIFNYENTFNVISIFCEKFYFS